VTDAEVHALLEAFCADPEDTELQRQLFYYIQPLILVAVRANGGNDQTFSDLRVDISYDLLKAIPRNEMTDPREVEAYVWTASRSLVQRIGMSERRWREVRKAIGKESLDERGGSQEARTMAAQTIELLHQKLPQGDWAVLEAYLVNGLEYNDIAKQLGISIETVRQRLSRARERARRIIDESKG
jgi:RNA polymerase sigma factor (sigma-70 family)